VVVATIRKQLRARFLLEPERLLGLPPVRANGLTWTAATSLDDDPYQPTDVLIDLALRAANAARTETFADIDDRVAGMWHVWLHQWPGEHYRYLAGLARETGARRVVEVGTLGGHSAVVLASHGAEVITYDLQPWRSTADPAIRDGDPIEQRIGDLSDAKYFSSQAIVFESAEIIFVDAPKDGVFEPAFLSLLVPTLRTGQLLVLDDIKLPVMLDTWRRLPMPKLDVTSFGHWSGTGLAMK
jgi:predicted O-methyltransferase YrrM